MDERTNRKEPFTLCIVVPCYNEGGVITGTAGVLLTQLDAMIGEGTINNKSYLCCVDDGSSDGTWQEIEALAMTTGRVRGIKLSANFGHPNALVAGLFSNKKDADVLLSIDADLQDDVSVLNTMMRHHHEGKLVVYGVRLDRHVDVLPKRITAALFYWLMRSMNERTVKGHADFRSADSRVIADLERFGEVNIYLRGLFPLIGYPSAEVRFIRKERHAGQSKYTYRKLLSLAWEGITSFSTAPLKLVFYAGLFMFVVAMIVATWIMYAAFSGDPVEGWASVTLLLITFSSLNMISLGVIGEYIGKIYKEVKHRPKFIIETTVR